VIRHPPVHRTQQRLHAGQLGSSVKRPSPPDFSRQECDCLCSAQNLPFGREHAHFLQQLARGQTEEDSHARILQRCQAKAALLQGGAKAACQGLAELALAVIENPTGGPSSFSVGYF
jgi:hypothetical protein